MNMYDARWTAAKEICTKVNNLIGEDDTLRIEYDNQIFFESFEIDEEFKEITLDSENCSHLVFSGDTAVDEGVYSPVADWVKQFKDRCKLYKEVHYDL